MYPHLKALKAYAEQFEYAYFDMDGLLTDLEGAAFELYNVLPLAQIQLSPEQRLLAETDPIRHGLAVALRKPDREISDRLLSQPEGWWAALDPLEDGVGLWRDLQSADVKTRILTSPMHSGAVAHGKIEWCKAHLGIPAWGDFRMHITVEKHELAQAGRLLVDDSLQNVQGFRKHGGEAVWWPHDAVFETQDDHGAWIKGGGALRPDANAHIMEAT